MSIARKDLFFERMENLELALTFNDIRLRSGYSEVAPKDVLIKAQFSRNIWLACPLVSAAMDTITEEAMAIAMAKLGGIGVIHKALTPEVQAAQVRRVKLHLNGLIEKPICVLEDETINEIEERRKKKEFSFQSFPVLNKDGCVVGLITRNDIDLSGDENPTAKAVMTPFKDLITAKVGTTPKDAFEILRNAHKKVLLIMNTESKLAGMYVFSDIKRLVSAVPTLYTTDKDGHLRVAAAIGTGEEELGRAEKLIAAGCDALVIDTSNGDTEKVKDTLRELKRAYPNVDVIVGNISEGDSAKRLAEWKADGIKVGQGPGSICTTRQVSGIGCPQVTAIYNCAKAVRGMGIPVCADGGIRFSGDITIALGLGAHTVMLGRCFAGTTETPGEIRDLPQGKIKIYRGMGSLSAMQENKASRERYQQSETTFSKLVPEGVESIVPFQGDVADVVYKQIGGLRAGMSYIGAKDLDELREKAVPRRMSTAGLSESLPHDVTVIDGTLNNSKSKEK